MRAVRYTITVEREYIATHKESRENREELRRLDHVNSLDPLPTALMYGPLRLMAGRSIFRLLSLKYEGRGDKHVDVAETFVLECVED